LDPVDPDPDPDPEHCLFVTELVDSGPSTEINIEREPTLTVALKVPIYQVSGSDLLTCFWIMHSVQGCTSQGMRERILTRTLPPRNTVEQKTCRSNCLYFCWQLAHLTNV
jgi:hypothetical protein